MRLTIISYEETRYLERPASLGQDIPSSVNRQQGEVSQRVDVVARGLYAKE